MGWRAAPVRTERIGSGDVIVPGVIGDLPQGFPGELHFEDAFDLRSQGCAVVGASFGAQFGPAPDDVFIDGRGAFLIHATA